MEYDSLKFKLQIWDTAGTERFRNITKSYYKTSHCIILVYDTTNRRSFENISNWAIEIDNFKDNTLKVLKVLIGNKVDDPNRVVTESEGQKISKILGFDMFYETSSETNQNINELFQAITEELIIRNKFNIRRKINPQIRLFYNKLDKFNNY